MFDIGEIVEASVYRTEQYGVFLHHERGELYVDLLELSWVAAGPANQRVNVGQSLKVRIIGKNLENNTWIASVRRANPEENPYLYFSSAYGQCFDGVVCYVSGPYVRVRFFNGAQGIADRDDKRDNFRIGDIVQAVIEEIDDVSWRMKVSIKSN